jgi:hypothetical protein
MFIITWNYGTIQQNGNFDKQIRWQMLVLNLLLHFSMGTHEKHYI